MKNNANVAPEPEVLGEMSDALRVSFDYFCEQVERGEIKEKKETILVTSARIAFQIVALRAEATITREVA